MTVGKHHDEILAYITENGATGVNPLARHLKMNPSTLQKYLERQSYFKRTESRKWDLPDRVNTDIAADKMKLMVDSVENALTLIKSQLAETITSVENAVYPINTLRRGLKSVNTPVAVKVQQLDPSLDELDKFIKQLEGVFKKFFSKCPDEYKLFLQNLDLHRLAIEKGLLYLKGEFGTDITAILLEKTNVLPEDTLTVLKMYQKEA